MVNKKYVRLYFLVMIIFFIILLASYLSINNFRNYVDENVLKKEVTENKDKTVNYTATSNSEIIVDNSNIFVVQTGNIKVYNIDRKGKIF